MFVGINLIPHLHLQVLKDTDKKSKPTFQLWGQLLFSYIFLKVEIGSTTVGLYNNSRSL